MKNLLYLIIFIPSFGLCATPFFNGTAANALHANKADTTVNTTYAVYADTAGLSLTCSGNANTATTATTAITANNAIQLGGQSSAYYAPQSGLNAVGISTGSIYSQLQSTGAALSVLTNSFNLLQTSWTTTNNGLNAITGKTSGGVQSYLAEIDSSTVKWYYTIDAVGQIRVQNYAP